MDNINKVPTLRNSPTKVESKSGKGLQIYEYDKNTLRSKSKLNDVNTNLNLNKIFSFF